MGNKKTKIETPNEIIKMLLPDEEVLFSVRQSRWKILFNPDTVCVTNCRVIRYSPSGFLGLHKEIEDYRYEDMANFKINKGPMYATITISHRFMSESLTLDNIPKEQVDEVSKAVESGIRAARDGTKMLSPHDSLSRNPLEILKVRYARGEITKEQYEEMKRTLGQSSK